MKIVLASSSEVGNPFADYLYKKCNLSSIITSPDNIAGRGRKILPNPFSAFCEELPVKQYKPANHNELGEVLKSLQPDLVVTVAYGRLIRKAELELPKFGWLNIHFSLLPRWRGASPVQQAILHGDAVTGVTVFRLDEGMDTGPVFVSREHKLIGNETSESLLKELSAVGIDALSQALTMLENGDSPYIQSSEGVTLAPKITKNDGQIDWTQGAKTIENKIRAMHPWPGAWSSFRGNRIIINSAIVNEEYVTPKIAPGAISAEKSILVECGVGQLELVEVTPEGKRKMSAAEWIRGVQNQDDMRFSSVED